MSENAFSKFWKQRIIDPLVAQITQGVTPRHLALSCALGMTLGIFPILGSTTLLCFIAGIIWKLNQPAIQAVNYLVYPVQIVMVPVFVRMGEFIFRADPVPLMPTQLVQEFSRGPGPFLAKYGMAGVYGITAWALVAPFLIALILFPLTKAFQKVQLATTPAVPKET